MTLPNDTSRCSNERCEKKLKCKRYLDCLPWETYSYADFNKVNCGDFIENELKKREDMREIKFKAQRVGDREWVYGSYTQMREEDHNECFRTEPHKTYHRIWQWEAGDWNMGGYANYEVIPETIGQFTGLKDKNGVEIYEGDIVIIGATSSVIKYFPKYGMFGLTGKSAYKKFDESEPMGSGGSSTRYKPYVLSEHYQRRMEVIGNIHDKNKEQ